MVGHAFTDSLRIETEKTCKYLFDLKELLLDYCRTSEFIKKWNGNLCRVS